MRTCHTEFFDKIGCVPVKLKLRRPFRRCYDLNFVPTKRVEGPGATKCFTRSLLCRKTRCVTLCVTACGETVSNLAGREDPVSQSRAVIGKRGFNASYFDDVDSNANDHAWF